MPAWRKLAVALALAPPAVVAASAGCGTNAVGVDACRQVEEARCRQALACGISLATPVHQGDDVEACVRFYDDACLHGLQASDPGAPAVAACVAAINGQKSCNIVLHPEQYDALGNATANGPCAWLTPTPVVDAGEAGDDGSDAPAETAVDGGSDGG